jgi:hypothetical protein
MANREWILSKCDAYIEAWRRAFGEKPSFVNTALAVSVAWHETRCGDAWPGPDGLVNTEDDENNWGATTLRSLNSAEQWILATHALKLLVDAGVGIRGDRLGFNNFRYSWQRYQSGNAFDIVQMQSALGLTPDGVFGPKSKAALEQWRAEYPGFPPEMMWPMVRERLPLNGEEAAVVRSITPSVSNGHALCSTCRCRWHRSQPPASRNPLRLDAEGRAIFRLVRELSDANRWGGVLYQVDGGEEL